MRRAALLVTLAAAAGCGSGSGGTVAHVGDAVITRAQLDAAVQHFEREAETEGRSFPERDTPQYKTAERQVLALLVYRAELVQSAESLGVPATNDEIAQRVKAAGEEQEEGGTFAEDSIRAQIAYEHVYGKVTADLPPKRRGAAMRSWLDRMRQRYEVDYEAGYEPAS